MASHRRFLLRILGAGAGFAAAGYALYVALAWSRYGHPAAATDPLERDPLVDRFMPAYDVVERHHVRVAAPAAVTLAAAREVDLFHQPVARALINVTSPLF